MVVVVTLAVTIAACSGGSRAETCDDIVDETISLLQRLIDEVDDDFGGITVVDYLESGGELPSVDGFSADAEAIDARAAELGCTQSEISTAVASRAGGLSATSDLGRFLIDAIRTGGL